MLLLISITILLLVFLTLAVHKNYIIEFDTKILDWFHVIKGSTLDSFFSVITWFGSLWVLMPLSLVLVMALVLSGHSSVAILFSIGFLAAVGSTYALKFALERGRPEIFDVIGDMPIDPSYPSAHTTQAFAFAFMSVIVAYMLNASFKISLATLFIGFAILVGLSRIYLQVHFPSDVFAGILVALVWAGIILYLKKWEYSYEKQIFRNR